MVRMLNILYVVLFVIYVEHWFYGDLQAFFSLQFTTTRPVFDIFYELNCMYDN